MILPCQSAPRIYLSRRSDFLKIFMHITFFAEYQLVFCAIMIIFAESFDTIIENKERKMKKAMIMMAGMTMMLASCGGLGAGIGTTGAGTGTSAGTNTSTSSSSVGSILGSILGSATSGETIGNVLSSVIGLDKLTNKSLVGTWKYDGPGCAFTSENALAKAGGEVVATQVEQKLKTEYDKLGFTKNNTYITFNEDKTFSAQVDGKALSGKWTFDESTQALKLSGLILNLNGYATRNGSGISILFESKKVLTLLQTVAALSGNSTLSTIGDISKNYDGVRVGFDFAK